jgi:hypothetical protein
MSLTFSIGGSIRQKIVAESYSKEGLMQPARDLPVLTVSLAKYNKPAQSEVKQLAV